MQEYNLVLREKKDEAKGTKSFVFEKPQGFSYIAGEFMYFTLPELKYPDERGAVRHFTLSSSPTEDYLSFTTRLREESGYKKTLNELPLGTLIYSRGPTGVFEMKDDVTNPQVMLAGGIGITPFRSRIKYVVDKNLPIEILLIYANSHTEEITFKKELDNVAKSRPNICVEYIISDPEGSQSPWTGRTGRIDKNLIVSCLEIRNLKLEIPTWWVCGPPPMVSAMEEILLGLGVSQNMIETEKFTGY